MTIKMVINLSTNKGITEVTQLLLSPELGVKVYFKSSVKTRSIIKKCMTNGLYPTDITDKQWELIEPLLLPDKLGGHPHSLDMRQVINKVLYLMVGGI